MYGFFVRQDKKTVAFVERWLLVEVRLYYRHVLTLLVQNQVKYV